MLTALRLLPVMIGEAILPRTLERVPEPTAEMNGEDNVAQYNRLLESKMAYVYAATLEVIARAGGTGSGNAIDLACGPGHFAAYLAQHLGYQDILGVDISPRMIETAGKNIEELGLTSQIQFEEGDVTNLAHIPDNHYSLSTFMDAAHHLDSLDDVAQVIREMDRITADDGVVVIVDLVRLKSRWLTEKYVNAVGWDYAEKIGPAFLEDFRNSMYASWSPDELCQATCNDSKRSWRLLVPIGLPTIQLIVGHADVEPDQVFNLGKTATTSGIEWRIFRHLLFRKSQKITGRKATR